MCEMHSADGLALSTLVMDSQVTERATRKNLRVEGKTKSLQRKVNCLGRKSALDDFCKGYVQSRYLYFIDACRLSRTCSHVSTKVSLTLLQQLTSSSIFASAMSCSLPLPLAIFCASLICDLTASSLKSSNGKPSTAFMLSTEFGCTIANPPETVSPCQSCLLKCL